MPKPSGTTRHPRPKDTGTKTAPPARAAATRGRTDFVRLARTTNADIRRQIAEDPDVAPEIDESWMTDAERVTPDPTKQGIYIRLDPAVLEYFKGGGKRYQTRINAVLRSYVKAQGRGSGVPSASARRQKGGR